MEKNKLDPSAAMGHLGLVFEFMGIILAPGLLGYWADSYFEIKDHWLFIAGVFTGFVYAVWHIYRRAVELENREDAPDHSRKGSVKERAQKVHDDMNSLEKKISSLKNMRKK